MSNDSNSFSYKIQTSKSPEEVFAILLNIEKWWSGLYAEKIEGTSQKINDEFFYTAGGGIHSSNQKLIELIPNKRVVWLITESNLTFLQDTSEWNNTKLCFDISSANDQTILTFTHEGLVPQIECYGQCSSAWTSYLDKLKESLK